MSRQWACWVVAAALVSAPGLCNAQDRQQAPQERPAVITYGESPLEPSWLRQFLTEAGPDGIVEVHQSTFDELADAALPIRVNIPAPAPFNIPGCDEIARIDLTDMNFYIYLDWMAAIGTGTGRWCGISFTVNVTAPATVIHNRAAGQLQLSLGSGNVRVTVDIPDWADWAPGVPDTFALSFDVDLSGTLGAIPPVPIQAAEFTIDTPRGPRHFDLIGKEVEVRSRPGFIELRGKVVLR